MTPNSVSNRLRTGVERTQAHFSSLLRQKPLALDSDERSHQAFDVVRQYTMLPEIRIAYLYEMVAHCEANGIPGDFVECGVWKGGAVGAMALANMEHSLQRRTLHLFDAFDDICEPDPEFDGHDVLEETASVVGRTDFSGRLVPMVGAYDRLGGHGSIELCEELIVNRIGYPRGSVEFHKGWFQDTVPAVARSGFLSTIAILRLDGDYFSSTKVCLENLFDLVSPGGFVVIDDYGAYEGCRRAVHEFLADRGLAPFLHYTDSVCRYWVKSND